MAKEHLKITPEQLAIWLKDLRRLTPFDRDNAIDKKIDELQNKTPDKDPRI